MNVKVFEMLREKAKVRQLLSGQVFDLGRKPLTVHHVQRFFRSAGRGVGIKGLHFHDLRHTFATRLVQAGEDPYKVQVLLGHKTPVMTKRYAHHYLESLRSAVEVLDRLEPVTNQSQRLESNIASI